MAASMDTPPPLPLISADILTAMMCIWGGIWTPSDPFMEMFTEAWAGAERPDPSTYKEPAINRNYEALSC